jgi:hypothetical protein
MPITSSTEHCTGSADQYKTRLKNKNYKGRNTYALTSQHQWLKPIILATGEAEIRRISVQGPPRIMVPETPIFKNTRAKWTGCVVQLAECLICQHLLCNKSMKP